MGQKFQVPPQKQDAKQQQNINQILQKRQKKNSSKLYLVLAIGGVVIAAILFFFYINAKSPSKLVLVDSHSDYFTSNSHLGKQYHLKDHVKKEVHPDFQRFSQRADPEKDPFWVGKEKDAKVIVKKFLDYSNTTLDKEFHYQNEEVEWEPHFNVINNEHYCFYSDLYHITHPDAINKNYFIFSDFEQSLLARQAVTDYGVDVLPSVENHDTSATYSIGTKRMPTETALIHSSISKLHHYFEVNKQLFCNFQVANHIPGKEAITEKDKLFDNYKSYFNKNFTNSTGCKKTMTYMPRSYRLYETDECKDFFTHIQSQDYQNLVQKDGLVYLLKEGGNRDKSERVVLLNPDATANLIKKYDNGEKCGNITGKQIIERYIPNPMKHEGFKLQWRIYYQVASINPLIIYVHKLPLIQKCRQQYDKFSKDKSAHICNDPNSNNTDMQFEEFRDYLIQKKIIDNPHWIEETLLPQVYRAVVHIVRSGQHHFFRDARFYELFAADFLMDETQRVWLLDNNSDPTILSDSVKRAKNNQIMYGDMFQVQFAYLRSRALRIINYAKFLQPLYEKYRSLDVSDFDRGFRSANKNVLDPDFKDDIRANNTFFKVLDENLEGELKFMGYLPTDCQYQYVQQQEQTNKKDSATIQTKK